jgi:hypothetical protein
MAQQSSSSAPATPRAARAPLEATPAIEYSMATGSAVTLPPGVQNYFAER